jgi:two-component system chemotaxis sensor kinase CheA
VHAEYLSMFIDETREHLQAWSDGMLEIEKSKDIGVIPIIFRAAHTIKGMSMTMGFTQMGGITHHAENLLDQIRNGRLPLSPDVVDALFHALDALETLLQEIEEHGEERSTDWASLLQELERVLKGGDSAGASAHAELAAASTESIVRKIADTAIEQGQRVYEIEIAFSDDCLMPMARWAQVRQAFDENKLLYTDPEPAVLEEGDYKGNIRFVLAADQDVEEIAQEILRVSEVRIVRFSEWQKQGNQAVRSGNLLPEEPVTDDEYVKSVIQHALEKGYRVYEVGVRLAPTTQMKSVRMYMVFEAAGGQDRLLYTNPPIDAIEREEIGQDVLFVLWSHDSIDKIRQAIESVAEVELVELREWKMNDKLERSENVVQQNRPKRSAVEGKKGTTIRVDTEKLDELMNLFSELVIDKTRLEQIRGEVKHDGLQQTIDHMSRISNQMQELIMSIRMVPVESVFQRFPRMVRDTAKQLGKEIEFTMSGEDTELDRTVVEEIGDPIMHMLRNSIDHGIEPVEERRKRGKPDIGHIHLRAYPSGNYVFIEVEDDGGGIDREKVLRKAREKGIVDANDTLTDQQVYQLLFASGFSTADKISDISGRGVGLDVVKAKIESLSGKVEIHSQWGKGTKFVIQLPMTLAILDGLLVKVGENPYVLPIGTIAEVTEIPEIETVHGKPVTVWRDQVVPVEYVGEVFGEKRTEEGNLILIQKGQQKMGIIVDDLLGQQEVVLKSLDRDLKKIPFFSGATILGDGTVALILDTNAFFAS